MSIHRLPNGKYSVRWREGTRNRGRIIDRRSDAIRFDAEIRRATQTGNLIPPRTGGQTFEEFAAEWFAAKRNLQRRTRELYAQLLDHHIAPYLGHVPLTQLTPQTCHRWQQERLDAGAGVVQIQKATTLLKGILDHAVSLELVPRNPAAVLKQPKAPKRVTVPLTPHEVEALRRWMFDYRPRGKGPDGRFKRAEHPEPRLADATLISTLAYAGLRPGEALALRWADFDGTRIAVTKAVAYGQEKETKTGATRSVPAPRALQADLAEWRLASPFSGPTDLLWPKRNGLPWTKSDWQNWTQRYLQKAGETIGRPKLRPYDLRHSSASLLIAAGRPVTEVAALLGHSPNVCLSTYAHVFDSMVGQEVVSVDEAIARAREPQEGREVA